MVALLTALLIFVYLVVVGMATTELVRFRWGVVRGWLIAPALGLAVVMLLVLALNQAGIPVHRFAVEMTVGLLALSGGVLWWRRPLLPWMRLAPFGAALLFALVYIGWQAFPYGFNWVGYGNGDALAYSESASRLMDHGFFDVPKVSELLGQDYTQASWFQFAPGMYRCGFDTVLAWAASLARMNPLAIYMPLMLALGLTQISAASALVMVTGRFRIQALLTAFLLAMSPLFGFSLIAQLGPQVGGFSLFLALCSVTLDSAPTVDLGWRSAATRAFITALLGLSLAVCYPEAFPFWGLAYVAFQCALTARGKANLGFQARVAALAALYIAILGPFNALRGYFTMIFAISFSQSAKLGERIYTGFEVFKLPHGAAALFGFSHYQTLPPASWLAVVLVLGFVLLYFCLTTAVADAIRRRPYAFVFLVMIVAGIVLFRSPNAFGLFKMGLYIQPLLMASLASSSARLRPTHLIAFLAAYLAISFSPHLQVMKESTGALAGLSAAGVTLPVMSPGSLLELDTPTQVSDSVLAVYLKGLRMEMLNARGAPGGAIFVDTYTKPLLGSLNPYPSQVTESERLANEVLKAYRRDEILGFKFIESDLFPRGKDQTLLATTSSILSYFNNIHTRMDPGREFYYYAPLDAARNHLVFINSEQGHDYYWEPGLATSFYSFEPDLYRRDRKFYGIGRYFLFEVLNPSRTLRVRVSLTGSIVGDGRTRLPDKGVVLADHQEPLGLVGDGAANVFSEPVSPVLHNGHYYLGIDFRTGLLSPPNRKAGLMRLYNKDIPLDVRKLIGYGRDISVVSEDDYQSLQRPSEVTRWPDDLFRTPGLEFSGFYEDGWVSDHALMKLGPSNPGQDLVIKGMVPGIGQLKLKGNRLSVWIEGRLASTKALPPGDFEIAVRLTVPVRITSLGLDFDVRESLPKGDDRPVAALIKSIAIK